MKSGDPDWNELVAQHRVDTALTEERAAEIWRGIVRERPEAAQLVLLLPGRPSARPRSSSVSFRTTSLVAALAVAAIATVLALVAWRRADPGTQKVAADRAVVLLETQFDLQPPDASAGPRGYTTVEAHDVTGVQPQRDRRTTYAKWNRCREAYAKAQLDEAERLCLRAAEYDPTYPPIHNTLGRIAADRGDLDGAQQRYATALEHDPEFVPALLGLSTCKVLLGDLDGAEEAVLRALSLAPDNERASTLAGRIRARRQRAPR